MHTPDSRLRTPDSLIIVSPGFAADESDTGCLPLQQAVVKGLRKQYPGLRIIVLALQYPFKNERYHWFGSEIIAFNGKDKGGLSRLHTWWKAWQVLRLLHQTTRIRGLFSFWYGECYFLGHHFAKLKGLKHYGWILGQDAKANNPYTRRVQPQPEEMVALSDFLQDEFERNYKIRPKHLITPGIDMSLFPARPISKEIDIMAAGSLIPLKRYDMLIEILAEIKKQRPVLKALLAGDGPQLSSLQQQINTAGLQQTLELTGKLSYPEVVKKMHQAKVFLHTSSYEGFGCVCLEALAAGASVISFTQPMKQLPVNWHVVKTKEEMIGLALQILNNIPSATTLEGYAIEGTVLQIGHLYNL